jgi:hypothetical protein
LEDCVVGRLHVGQMVYLDRSRRQGPLRIYDADPERSGGGRPRPEVESDRTFLVLPQSREATITEYWSGF